MERQSVKVFVSLPMRDLFEDEVRKEQQRLLELAGEYLNSPVTLIDTYQANGKYDPLECLGEAIKRMARADCVLFGDGWENARGCEIEMACARKYGKKTLIEHGNLIQEVF